MVTDHGVPEYMPGKITLVLEGWAGVYLLTKISLELRIYLDT